MDLELAMLVFASTLFFVAFTLTSLRIKMFFHLIFITTFLPLNTIIYDLTWDYIGGTGIDYSILFMIIPFVGLLLFMRKKIERFNEKCSTKLDSFFNE